MWEEMMSKIAGTVTDLAFQLIGALLVLVIGLKLAKLVVKKVATSKGYQKLDTGVQSFLRSFMTIGLDLLVVLTAAYVLGIPMTSFLTLLASSGVAIGLALQGALSNLAGGVIILIFKPFKVGDFVEAGGYTGVVESITIFYTIMLTVDNKRVTLPNGTLTNAAVVNYSCEETRRVDLPFSVAYASDLDQVKAILLEEAAKQGQVLMDPAPFARMTAQKDSALEVTLRVWCKAEHYWDVFFDLNENVKVALDHNGIVIPFQQVDVHMHTK